MQDIHGNSKHNVRVLIVRYCFNDRVSKFVCTRSLSAYRDKGNYQWFDYLTIRHLIKTRLLSRGIYVDYDPCRKEKNLVRDKLVKFPVQETGILIGFITSRIGRVLDTRVAWQYMIYEMFYVFFQCTVKWREIKADQCRQCENY